MDKLEKFVRENRQAFDAKTAKAFVWEGIESKLNEQAESKGITKVISLRSRIYRYAKVAAVGLVLLTIGGFLGSYWTDQNQEKQFSFGVINEEYQELETFYAAQVNLQLNQLGGYRLDESLMKDIEELDASFEELQKELKIQGVEADSEEIINAMIDNYQSKIEILERVLSRLERENKNQQSVKNNKDGKVSL